MMHIEDLFYKEYEMLMYELSLVKRKPVFVLYKEQRRRSACISSESISTSVFRCLVCMILVSIS